ncbi:MAG TPA: C1 family peptidase [Stellaceae bacterium]
MPDPQVRHHKIQRYGWIPDLPDARDHLYAAPPAILGALPPKVDLRPGCPNVYDQGQLGSCTGNSIAGAVQFDRMKQNLADAANLVPSRLFIYYNERVIEGTVAQDSGAQIRDGIKSVAQLGVCFESGTGAWPYNTNNFSEQPPPPCYHAALQDKITQYSRLVPILSQLKGCVASGYPFVFGFTVYESFESQQVASTGVVPMPAAGENVLGGHAVMAVGYDDSQQRFIVRNSWGDGWGLKGYFLMPYAYVTDRNLADDFWTIRLVAAPAAVVYAVA